MQGKLVQAEYHLSLSRTVPVRKHQLQPLLADLRRCLAHHPRRAAGSAACRASLLVHLEALKLIASRSACYVQLLLAPWHRRLEGAQQAPARPRSCSVRAGSRSSWVRCKHSQTTSARAPSWRWRSWPALLRCAVMPYEAPWA